jgi:hypothetical protein
MFRALGILVLLYACYALFQGEVYAKHRWHGKRVFWNQSPGYFSAVLAVYLILGVALIFVF